MIYLDLRQKDRGEPYFKSLDRRECETPYVQIHMVSRNRISCNIWICFGPSIFYQKPFEQRLFNCVIDYLYIRQYITINL